MGVIRMKCGIMTCSKTHEVQAQEGTVSLIYCKQQNAGLQAESVLRWKEFTENTTKEAL